MKRKTTSKKEDRRKFLKDASLMGAALAGVSIAGTAFAQQKAVMKTQMVRRAQLKTGAFEITTKHQAVEKVLIEAMKTGDMRSAITKYGRTLSSGEQSALNRLTASDLKALDVVSAKFIGTDMAKINVGNIIF